MASGTAKLFDDMSVPEQIEHVQQLWDRIAQRQDRVPVPDWHRVELRDRLQRVERGETTFSSAEDVSAELRAKFS